MFIFQFINSIVSTYVLGFMTYVGSLIPRVLSSWGGVLWGDTIGVNFLHLVGIWVISQYGGFSKLIVYYLILPTSCHLTTHSTLTTE